MLNQLLTVAVLSVMPAPAGNHGGTNMVEAAGLRVCGIARPGCMPPRGLPFKAAPQPAAPQSGQGPRAHGR